MDDLSRRQRTGGPAGGMAGACGCSKVTTGAGGWPGVGDRVVGADVAWRPSAPARDTGPRPETSGKEPTGDRREDNSRSGRPHRPRGRTPGVPLAVAALKVPPCSDKASRLRSAPSLARSGQSCPGECRGPRQACDGAKRRWRG